MRKKDASKSQMVRMVIKETGKDWHKPESRKYKRGLKEKVYDFVMEKIVYPIFTWGNVPRD